MKKVLVFGTFDGLHQGHLNFFKQARKHGGYLIVVVGRDGVVKKIKGKLPIKNERQRLKELKKSKLADKIVLGDKKNPYLLIKKLAPDVICLGYDQKAFTANLAEKLRESGLKTPIKRMRPYKPKKFHSTILNKNAGRKNFN